MARPGVGVAVASASPHPLTSRLVAVVGPTATGKSALGVALADALGGEVVNADSMQLYRGMDIGTAKLTDDERRGVPHHLLDIWSVTQPASVADYQRRAVAQVDRLLASGRCPVLVGGSGLYVRAVVDRIEFPGTDDSLRAALEDELARVGAEVLHARLARLDPAAAVAILPTNGRRVVRALEVIELTGQPFTASLPSYDAGDHAGSAVQIGLDLPDGELDARVDARARQMFAAGLLDEVARLAGEGLRDGRTASRAIGYAQALAVLDGLLTEAEAVVETARATRRFVRRQRSWFRRDPRIHWLAPGPDLLDRALTMVTTGHSRTAT